LKKLLNVICAVAVLGWWLSSGVKAKELANVEVDDGINVEAGAQKKWLNEDEVKIKIEELANIEADGVTCAEDNIRDKWLKEDEVKTGFGDVMRVESRQLMETMLPKNIKKKENIIRMKYCYPGDFENSPYKYITVRVEITYLDVAKDDKVIAAVFMEYFFRYNEKLIEAKCLSTNHGQICADSKYKVSVFSRTKNLGWDSGESYGLVTVVKNNLISKTIDDSKVIFRCNSSGNTVHQVYSA
jgi:hypothetical protein